MRDLITRRKFLSAATASAAVGVSGCSSSDSNWRDDIQVTDIEVLKQATRVGVKLTVKNSYGSAVTVPFAVKFYDSDGEIVHRGCLEIGLDGAAPSPDVETETGWFELGSVESVDRVHRANVDVSEADSCSVVT